MTRAFQLQIRLSRRGAALALGLACAAPAVAAPAPISPRFTHLSVEHGLTQSSVLQILQDRRGFMWFGTQEGLNRYDGYRFIVHRAREQAGFLGDHQINSLVEDRRGDLWVGTSRGLYRHDLATGRFDLQAPAAARLEIRTVVEAGDGRIFFTASDDGLWVLEPGGRAGGRRLASDELGGNTAVTALARGPRSAVWAAGNGRLLQIELATRGAAVQTVAVLGDIGAASVLAGDARGDVWIGRRDGELLRYRPSSGQVDRFPQAPRGVLALLPGKDGALWIGTRAGGLGRLDPETGAVAVYRHDPEDPTSLSRDDVDALYEDPIGSLWIGTWNGGVNRLDPGAQAFRRLRHRPQARDSLPADDVTALTEAPDGQLWLVSRGGLLAAGDPRSGRFRTRGRLRPEGSFTAIALLGARVLVGTANGLRTLDLASGREVALDEPLRRQRLSERRTAFVQSAAGATWIGSERALLRVTLDERSRTGLQVERFEPPLASDLSAACAAAAGGLWLGSEAGELARAEWEAPAGAVSFRKLELGDAASASLAAHGFVTSLHEDPRGQLWVGTRRGLGRIDPKSGSLAWLGDREGLPSTSITGLLGDANGRVWVGTNSGLTRIDPRNGGMIHFGEHEGAQGKGYADGAYAAGGSGLLYFAGEGITAFDPREVRVSTHRPAVVLTGLEILRRRVAPRWLEPGSPLERAIDSQAELTLAPNATVFSVEMAPLDYSDPASNRLAYRLEGFDPDWIETDAQNRVATYTRLAAGDYRLRVRARTKNGPWSEQEATLAIRILPPWWRTTPALAGWIVAALGAAGLMWAAGRRRTQVRLALLERETLRRESLTDPLTGLYNRRFLTTYLQHEVPKLLREYRSAGPAASGQGADLLLLLIDVDRFKAINDRFSHAMGDRVLARIAEVLREQIRDSDLAVRWGGDEFLVVSRSVRRERAEGAVERLRQKVEALGLELAAEGGPACTLSIGHAPFPFLVHEPGALTWEQTLDLADHALQLTKSRGRNSHTGLLASGGVSPEAVVAFLAAGRGAALPDGIEVLASPTPGAGS